MGNPNARNARPIPYYPQNDRTSVDNTKKKVSQEMGFSLKQNKKESFLPPFKTKTDKNKNFPYKSNEKNSLHYSVFVSSLVSGTVSSAELSDPPQRSKLPPPLLLLLAVAS